MEAFDGTMGGNLEGKVSIDEFLLVHRELAMIIPNDETFVGYCESYWGISE